MSVSRVFKGNDISAMQGVDFFSNLINVEISAANTLVEVPLCYSSYTEKASSTFETELATAV